MTLELNISGQIMGGKNNMIVTRRGLHFPKPAWAAWRNSKVQEIKSQLPTNWSPISNEVSVTLDYIAGDKRRRDMPAIIDSIWHVLEKAGVVVDDTQLWVTSSKKSYNKTCPMANLVLEY